jgi:hypothetical protein
MRNRLGWLAALGVLPFAACGSPVACSGDNCIQIAGDYVFVLKPAVSCSIWEASVPPSSLMTITQDGSSISATLWPVTDNPHFFTGTLSTNNSINIGESQQNQLLGIPYGTITGVFSSTAVDGGGQPPFYFSGQLFLQGGGSGTSGGSSTTTTGCTGSSSMTAEEQAGSVIVDGGTDVTPDAGSDGG